MCRGFFYGKHDLLEHGHVTDDSSCFIGIYHFHAPLLRRGVEAQAGSATSWKGILTQGAPLGDGLFGH